MNSHLKACFVVFHDFVFILPDHGDLANTSTSIAGAALQQQNSRHNQLLKVYSHGVRHFSSLNVSKFLFNERGSNERMNAVWSNASYWNSYSAAFLLFDRLSDNYCSDFLCHYCVHSNFCRRAPNRSNNSSHLNSNHCNQNYNSSPVWRRRQQSHPRHLRPQRQPRQLHWFHQLPLLLKLEKPQNSQLIRKKR